MTRDLEVFRDFTTCVGKSAISPCGHYGLLDTRIALVVFLVGLVVLIWLIKRIWEAV